MLINVHHVYPSPSLIQRVGVMSLEVTGDKLISGGDDSVIRIWNTNNWTCEQILRAHQVCSVCVLYHVRCTMCILSCQMRCEVFTALEEVEEGVGML